MVNTLKSGFREQRKVAPLSGDEVEYVDQLTSSDSIT